jgi:hypothetical protein
MLQQWNIRSRSHHCAVTERPFEDGEKHYTAIYFDPKAGEYTRRDVSLDAWEQETTERKPFSFWKSVYEKSTPDGKPEITPREDALSMLQRLIEEGNPYTENARYILAAMLERKRVLSPKDRKENEEGIMLIYENKKTGEIYIVRDPELRLDEVAGVQEEVATLLGFGGPAVEAAKVAKVEIGPDGKIIRRKGDAKKKGDQPAPAEVVPPVATPSPDQPEPASETPASSEAPTADESLTDDQATATEEAEADPAEEADDVDEEEEDDFEEDEEDLDEDEDSDSEDDSEDDSEAEAIVEIEETVDVDVVVVEDDEDGDEDLEDEEDLAEEDLAEEDEDEEDLDDEEEDDGEEVTIIEEDEGESVMIEEEEEDEDSK